MLPDLQSVVRLQDLDNRVAELTREISALPGHIAEIEKKLESHQRKLDADRAALSANQKDRKKAEADIQVQEQKISKLKGQMLDAKTNEIYRAFQTEIEFCEKEIRRHEDRILELMSESEPLEKNVKAAEIALGEEKKQVEAEKQQARERTDVTRKALDELNTERKGLVAGITPSVYRNYERIRKGRKGVAVAEAVDGRCSMCHMAVRLQFFQDLRKGDQVMVCESCGRILYYNPPIPVEDLGGDTEAAQASSH
jgi:predicted  nucleic acid-binding Zn-ribbon protein